MIFLRILNQSRWQRCKCFLFFIFWLSEHIKYLSNNLLPNHTQEIQIQQLSHMCGGDKWTTQGIKPTHSPPS
jgi:hypothetical protein